MSTTLEEIAADALKLDLDDRAALAEKLLLSLDEISDAENERLWLDEVDRRREELRTGKVKALPGEEVLARIAAELK